MRAAALLLPLALAVSLPACSATHVARPLPRGSSQFTASLGGPYLPDAVVTKVMPYLTLGWQRGVSDDLTLGGALHATMAAYGVAAGELSATRRLAGRDDAKLALAGVGHACLFAGRGGSRIYPAVGAVGSWRPGARTMLYGGGLAVAQFGERPSVVMNPLVGVQRDVGRRLALQTDVKWMAANVDTRAGVFEGESSIGGRGALAVQLGVVLRRGRTP
jgi:hypothetical protein